MISGIRLSLLSVSTLAQAAIAQSPEATELAIDLRTTRPIVEVFVNGEVPFRFLVDTGASQSMVSWDLANRLQLPREGNVLVGAPNSSAFVRAPAHRIKELRVGDLKFFGVKATAILDDAFAKSLDADGILSAQDFRGYLVTLDYRNLTLRIRPGRLPEADGGQVLECEERHGIPGIELDVMGKKTFFHLDSGSPFYIALPGTMLTTLDYERKPQLAGTAQTIMGSFLVYHGKLAGDVKFGKYTVERPTVEVLDKMPFGNLGYRFFREYRITFDYSAHRVMLEHWREAIGGR